MELRVNEIQFPEALSFNYEELKQELQERVRMYESLVYNDEQIKEAKADRAALNKLKKALNDERIRREKEWMVPFNDFKTKVNEIIGIIDKPVLLIDKQVKEYEEKQKQEKADKIAQYWDSVSAPEWMNLDRIFNEKWLGASVSMKSVQEEINSRLEQVEKDLATLADLPEFGFEAAEVYKTTLDLNKAISEAKRMAEIAKAKAEREAEQARLAAEAEAKKQEREVVNAPDGGSYIQDEDKQGFAYHEPMPQVPEKEWVVFKCLLTIEDAQALGQFFRSRGIAFEQV
jgi:hypothetical protein